MDKNPGIYKKIDCSKTKKRPKGYIFTPAPHQLLVMNYFRDSIYKGLLLYHKLGSGKSCSSIMIADDMLRSKKVDKVYVLSPGSLRKNWVSEYCRVCGSIEKELMSKFTFITYNYNIITHLSKYDFTNSLVIIDEVHNLINGYKNNSKNATGLYEKIMVSNARVLALSGTPIIQENISQDWKNLARLLDGGRSDKTDTILEKNVKGIVSYYPGDATKYPTVYIKPIQRVQMTPEQYLKYKNVYQHEQKVRNMGPPDPKMKHKNPVRYNMLVQDYIKAKKYLLSRMVSNCFYEPIQDIITYKTKESIEVDTKEESDVSDASDDDVKKAFSMKCDSTCKIYPDKLKKEQGWITKKALSNGTLLSISPKFVAIFLNIIKHINSKHVVYSFYKTRSGVQLIYSLLTHCGITAELYSGDISSKKREEILNQFNDESNRNGKHIKVLLLTEAGSEGISVLECNNIHIVESSTRENRTRQAIGRVIRYKSHEKLPKEEQYVNVWRYWSVYGKEKLVDEELFYKGVEHEKNLEMFTNMLIKNSIEQ